MAVQKADYIWRDYEVDGVSASGAHKPILREQRAWGTEVERTLQGVTAGATIYGSKSDMDADTSQAANAMAWVLGDDTAANNGIYQFDGTSTWTRLGDLPYSYIKATNAGAGTANAIQATTSVPVPAADGGALIALPIVADNTASPVTVAFNGGAALTIKTRSGEDPAYGGLQEGDLLAGYVTNGGTEFRLIVDPNSLLHKNAAEAAQAAAEAAQAAAEGAAETVVVARYNSRAGAEAANISAAVQSIELTGYAAAGDGGGALFSKVASKPDHDGWLQSADGSIFAITKRTVRASQFDAFPSDTVSQHEKLNAALAYLEDVGGGCLEIDKDEPYLISGTVGMSGLTSSIIIENPAGGVLKAAGTLDKPVMRFYSGTTEPGTGRLTAYGLRVDNSDGVYAVGDASCTGFSANYLAAVYMHDYQCIGGFDALAETTGSGGDSGFGSVGCRYVLLDNTDIRKQPDAAIYPSWDNSGTIDGYIEVRGGYFYRNNLVLTAKRNLKEVVWRGGLLLENSGGLMTAWVDNGGWVPPARSILIEGAKIKKTIANCITLRGDCHAHIIGNVIEDVGYYYDGSGNVGANAIAVALQGVSGASVKNNRFEMAEWMPVAEYAFKFSNDTRNGIKKGGNHSTGENTLKNWSRYAAGGSDGDPSIHENETFIDCPTVGRFASGFHPASTVTYRNSDDVAKYTRIDGREIVEGAATAVIADDDFYDFGDLSPVGFGKVEIFTVGVSSVLVASTMRILTSSAPHISALTGATTDIDLSATGTPTGTTGADGHITIYAVQGHFYIENRSGGEVVFRARWETSS